MKKCMLLFIAFGSLFVSGCATAPSQQSYARNNEDGLPVFAAFVYQEKVHAAGKAFSAAQPFWDHCYPTAAESVQQANRFESYDEALTSGADIIVIAKNLVYGSRDTYKTSLVIYVRDQNRNLLSETGFQGKSTTRKDESETFHTLGRLTRDHIKGSKKVKALIKKKAAEKKSADEA